MKVTATQTRLFQEKEDLAHFIFEHIPRLHNDDILTITSKIVALSEGRTADPVRKEEIIAQESDWALQTEHAWLTLRGDSVMVAAGIDESNSDGRLILLPRDSFNAAEGLRKTLCAHYKINKLGILITDSRVAPLRAGTTGIALGYAGFRGIRDYRGLPDLFGQELTISKINVADSLAAAAVLLMGEGSESSPLAVISNAPADFNIPQNVDLNEIAMSVENDLYIPFFKALPYPKIDTTDL